MDVKESTKVEEFLGAEEYVVLTKQLIKKLDGLRFNSVLGVGRGGAMLGIILSHTFKKPFFYLQVRYIDVKRGLIEVGWSMLPEILSPVLIVDDLCDTGRTILGIVEHLKEQKVLTAVLYLKPWSCFRPDYWVKKTEAWVVFFYEDIKVKGRS